MRKLVLIFVLIGVFCCGSGVVFGFERSWSGSVLMENDSRFLRFVNPDEARDRHYTNGVKVSFGVRTERDLAERLFGASGLGGEEGDLRTAIVGFAGQSMFTPDHVGEPALRDRDDMPFAGWLYGGVSLQRAQDLDFENFEFKLGVIGPSSQTAETQRWIHQIFFAPEPKGWEGQLGDEVAFDFGYQRKWKKVWDVGGNRAELIPQAGFTVGTVHRNANAGLLYRIGINLPDDFGPGRIEDTAAATGDVGCKGLSFYVFARGGAKAVEHNRFLSGLGVEPFLFEGQVGIVVGFYGLEFGYSQTFMSDEFKGQSESDSFSALTISYRHSY